MSDKNFGPNHFWHMQIHPTGEMSDFAPNIPYILEHRHFIGLGDCKKGQDYIKQFNETMAVNDIVAMLKERHLSLLCKLLVVLTILTRMKTHAPAGLNTVALCVYCR